MLLAPKVLPRILSQAQSGGVKAILCVPYAARDTHAWQGSLCAPRRPKRMLQQPRKGIRAGMAECGATAASVLEY